MSRSSSAPSVPSFATRRVVAVDPVEAVDLAVGVRVDRRRRLDTAVVELSSVLAERGRGLDAGRALDRRQDARRQALARRSRRRDHDVALEAAVDRVGERHLEPLREDRHEDDQPDADHQRRRRHRGARRCCGSCSPAPACPATPNRRSSGQPRPPASGRTRYVAIIATRDEQDRAPNASDRSASCALPSPVTPFEQEIGRDREQAGEDPGVTRKAPARQGHALAQRRDRRHAGRAHRRDDRGDHGHADADDARGRRPCARRSACRPMGMPKPTRRTAP